MKFLKLLVLIAFSVFWFFVVLWMSDLNCYEFQGRHLIAQYEDCDPQALQDEGMLCYLFEEAIICSGANVLGFSVYEYDNEGISLIYMLSESHASIHTDTASNYCFIDLFTCGTSCNSDSFEAVLRGYLHPSHVSLCLMDRSQKCEVVYAEEGTCLKWE